MKAIVHLAVAYKSTVSVADCRRPSISTSTSSSSRTSSAVGGRRRPVEANVPVTWHVAMTTPGTCCCSWWWMWWRLHSSITTCHTVISLTFHTCSTLTCVTCVTCVTWHTCITCSIGSSSGLSGRWADVVFRRRVSTRHNNYTCYQSTTYRPMSQLATVTATSTVNRTVSTRVEPTNKYSCYFTSRFRHNISFQWRVFPGK